MRKHRLDPAHSVIQKFGGVDAVSAATGRSISRVYRWMYPKEAGGTDGMIPQAEAAKLLSEAKHRRVKLSPADFFPAEPVAPTTSPVASVSA